MSELLHYTTERVVLDYDALRETCGRISVAHLALVIFTGDDRKGWLQGQATANIRSLMDGGSAAFALCEATGHTAALCELWHVGDRFLITTHPDAKAAVLRRAEEMVVVEDVEAADGELDWTLVSLQGPQASAVLGRLTELPSLDAGTGEIEGVPVMLARANRTGLGGWDVWVPREGGAAALAALEEAAPMLDPEAVEAARIEAGVPLWGKDVNARTLPPELGPAYEGRAISYTKGCYVGQEVLQRIHSRGHVNRVWRALVAERPIPAGSTLSHPLRTEAGTVTSSAFSPDFGYVAGAMVRSEASDEGEIVTVATPDGPVSAEVRRMPLLRFG